MVLLETALPRHSVSPTPGRGLEKVVGRVGGYTTPTLSWGLSGSVVSMGSEKRGMKGRDLKPQGLKGEPMAREKQRGLGTTRAAVAASLCRKRQGNQCLNREERGALEKMGCRPASWAGLSVGGASMEINIQARQSRHPAQSTPPSFP